MKPGFSKKNKILLISLIACLACMGYIFYSPKLINADKPFIDLSGSVGIAVGNAQNAYNDEKENPVVSPTPVPSPTEAPTPVPTRTPAEEFDLNATGVKVSGTVITIGNSRCVNTTDFTDRIAKATKVKLTDDYAELKTFRSVLKTLDSLGIEYRIETIY